MLFRAGAGEPVVTEPKRRPLDNPRVLIFAAVLLLGLLAGLFWLAARTSEIAAPLVTDVLLYVLVAVDLALLAALLFVLARNLLKLWVEQRRALPFARFRAKLVAAMLAMTVVPALLVLVSGSQIITNIASVWFSEPVNEVLGAAQKLSQTYYRERQDVLELRAHRLAQDLSPVAVSEGNLARITPLIEEAPKTMRDGLVDLYRAVEAPGLPVDIQLLAAAESHTLAQERVRASADQLAIRAVQSARAESTFDELDTGGIMIRAASPIFNSEQKVVGAVVVSQHVSPEIKALLVRAIAANERYQGLRVLRGPIQGFYLSIFLTVTLLIVISATWLGLYLAKRITRPVQMLAEGAKAIGAGQLDLRLEAESGDELGSLVESFNMMAAELQTSREKLEQSRQDLERKNLEVDARRRYIETILERVATGVISLDAEGRISTVNGAAERLLGLDASAVGRSAGDVFSRDDLRALQPLVDATRRGAPGGVVQEITLAREDREVHLAAAATVLAGDAGRPEGAVLVLDDVTPLIRAQRVAAWRDVARRLAHEIKNPLTPIQLSAERLRRHFGAAPEATRALVSECTDAIIVEVEALKNLVDEFAQFARLRGPRLLPCDLNKLIDDTLQLYAGVLQQGSVQFVRQFARDLPPIRLDVDQIRQVVINLVDNAIEALGGPAAPARANGDRPTIALATSYDARNHTVRLVVTDNGPGVAPADRDKLFMPYYSTKGRGSGLGLAICRRIVVEHGGAIEVSDAQPTGTVFTIELAA